MKCIRIFVGSSWGEVYIVVIQVKFLIEILRIGWNLEKSEFFKWGGRLLIRRGGGFGGMLGIWRRRGRLVGVFYLDREFCIVLWFLGLIIKRLLQAWVSWWGFAVQFFFVFCFRQLVWEVGEYEGYLGVFILRLKGFESLVLLFMFFG